MPTATLMPKATTAAEPPAIHPATNPKGPKKSPPVMPPQRAKAIPPVYDSTLHQDILDELAMATFNPLIQHAGPPRCPVPKDPLCTQAGFFDM